MLYLDVIRNRKLAILRGSWRTKTHGHEIIVQQRDDVADFMPRFSQIHGALAVRADLR